MTKSNRHSAEQGREHEDGLEGPHRRLVADLIREITSLGIDSEYFLDALTQKLRSLRPVRTKPVLSRPERRFLVETGAFAEFELEGIETAISRGVLQLVEIESWMFRLFDSISAEEAAGRLELVDEELLLAWRRGEILALPVAGRLRFPRWQFVTSPSGRLLPGLKELITAMPDAPHEAWAAFMHMPHEDLRGEGAHSPLRWLMNGGDVNAVLDLLVEEPW